MRKDGKNQKKVETHPWVFIIPLSHYTDYTTGYNWLHLNHVLSTLLVYSLLHQHAISKLNISLQLRYLYKIVIASMFFAHLNLR
jgi:hypothetical protein